MTLDAIVEAVGVEPHNRDERVALYHADCLDILAAMPENSVDAVVTDPPYGLEFMGEEWDRLGACADGFGESLDSQGKVDYHGKGNAPFGGGGKRIRYGQSARSVQAWHQRWAEAALRVLKPGGHLVAFGGTRTHHRLWCALEDAGFEIRDTIGNLGMLGWIYGSGFPKSLDVSKAIDKAAGAERKPTNERRMMHTPTDGGTFDDDAYDWGDKYQAATAPATDAARRWQGWGTALKPAWEPIVLARKPLVGTVAANVQEHGTGSLNVDGCRIGTEPTQRSNHGGTGNPEQWRMGVRPSETGSASGRWPANVVLDEEAAAMLDAQSGERTGTGLVRKARPGAQPFRVDRGWNQHGMTRDGATAPEDYGDSGGASRFFYCAKASRSERGKDNNHPTVKPLALMRWLCRLVTPPNGLILDPFIGSGTTALAAVAEGFRCVGIDSDDFYLTRIANRAAQMVLL